MKAYRDKIHESLLRHFSERILVCLRHLSKTNTWFAFDNCRKQILVCLRQLSKTNTCLHSAPLENKHLFGFDNSLKQTLVCLRHLSNTCLALTPLGKKHHDSLFGLKITNLFEEVKRCQSKEILQAAKVVWRNVTTSLPLSESLVKDYDLLVIF